MFSNHPRVFAAKRSPFSASLPYFHKTALCAALLLGGVGGVMRASCAQAAPESLQASPGGTQNVHELSLLANAHYGNLNAVDGAMSRGADVNARDADGRTALMLAADYNSGGGSQVSNEFKRLLAASGLSGNTGSGFDGSLYWYLRSAADLDSEPARYLLRQGAIQRTDPKTSQPVLVWRPTSGNVDVLQALIRQKADVNARDKDGRTALIHAARDANTPALRLLLDKENINARDTAGVSALGYAAGSDNEEGVQALKAGGAVVDARSADGPILLRYAIKKRDAAQERALLAQGVDVNAKDSVETPLVAAVISSNAEAVELLVQRGADVNAAGPWTPMGMSLFCHNERMTELLLKQGANPNGMGSYGESYFLEAALMGSPQLIQAFVEKGADVNTHDAQGSTPLLRAMAGVGGIFRSDPDDASAVSNAQPRGDTRDAGTLAVARLLLAKGADVNAANKDGETALLEAVRPGRIDTVIYLIEHGANVNAKTNQGVTPLSQAIRFHQDAMVSALRAAGATQ